jgi:hypothetical protein
MRISNSVLLPPPLSLLLELLTSVVLGWGLGFFAVVLPKLTLLGISTFSVVALPVLL